MNLKEIQKAVKSQNKKIVELMRGEVDEYSMLIVPEYVSSEFLCAKFTSDFNTDGWKFVRNRFITDITSADTNETLGFYNKIYAAENLFDYPPCRHRVNSFKELFQSLVASGEAVTVECNFEEAIDYYVGWVVSLNGNIAVMKCFDGNGVVFKDNVKVNLEFVSMLTLGDRYTTVMSKHIKG